MDSNLATLNCNDISKTFDAYRETSQKVIESKDKTIALINKLLAAWVELPNDLKAGLCDSAPKLVKYLEEIENEVYEHESA